jgi:biopolymer transport protein ExbD
MGRMSGINVTPYIDILLVMLIIFMVITPFGPKGMDVRLPEEAAPLPADVVVLPFAIVVEVGSDGGLTLNRKEVSADALAGEISRLIGRVDRYQLFVGAARDVPYANVIRTVDLVRGVTTQPVSLLLRTVE